MSAASSVRPRCWNSCAPSRRASLMTKRHTPGVSRTAWPRWCGGRPRPESTSSATANSARRSAGRNTRSNGWRVRTPAVHVRPAIPSRAAPTARASPNSTPSSMRARRRRPTSESICVGPIAYTGQAELQRDIDNFKAALKGVKVEEAFLPVAAPSSVIPDRKNEYYKSDEELQMAIAEAMHTEYKMIVDAGFLVQLDDARAAVTYRPHGAAHDLRGIPQLARAPGRDHEPCARGHSRGPRALSRLLGQLARAAHHRRAACRTSSTSS